MKKCFATKHDGKLVIDAFEQLLNARAVANERGWHVEVLRWHVTVRRFDVIWDPNCTIWGGDMMRYNTFNYEFNNFFFSSQDYIIY